MTLTNNGSLPLSISDNAASSPQSITLSGTGVTPTVYFSDSFKSGNFSKWKLPNSDSTGQAVVQSSLVNSGLDAVSLTNASGQYVYLYMALPGGTQSQTYTRFYFQLSTLANGTILAITRNASGRNVREIDYNRNTHGLDIYFWGSSGHLYSVSTSTNALTANTWYSIEVQDTETTVGVGQVWLNDTLVGTVNANLSTSSPYARLMIFDGAAGTIYVDDVEVASSYI